MNGVREEVAQLVDQCQRDQARDCAAVSSNAVGDIDADLLHLHMQRHPQQPHLSKCSCGRGSICQRVSREPLQAATSEAILNLSYRHKSP